MSSVTIEPAQEVARHLQRIEQQQRTLKGCARHVKEMLNPRLLQDTRKLKAHLARLRNLSQALSNPAGEVTDLADKLEEWARDQERNRPLYFGQRLRQAAEQAGVPFASLTAEPPEYSLDPFTVAVDFTKGRAELRYARLPVAEAELDPARVLEARSRALASLQAEALDPEVCFDRLLEAYRRVLASRGAAFGQRVDLVELLPEMAFLCQPEKFRHDPVRENFRPYGRVRLAWDLARLRAAGGLSRQGLRLSLGAATLGTTRQKDNVLYLESEPGRGQYYLTLWFTREGEGS